MIRVITFEQVEVGDTVSIERLGTGFEVIGVVIAKDSERVMLAGSDSWFNLSHYSPYDSTISLLDRSTPELPTAVGAVVEWEYEKGKTTPVVRIGENSWAQKNLHNPPVIVMMTDSDVKRILEEGDAEIVQEGAVL